MPPSTTIDRIVADSRKVKDSGEMKPCRDAKNEPAKPANIAPMLTPRAAGPHDRQNGGRLQEGERPRRDEALPRRKKRAGEAGEHRAHGERGELGVGGIDAERAAGGL